VTVPIDREAFRAAYRQATREIEPFLSRDRLAVIARHNLGLHPDRFDIRSYLRASERRYVLAVDQFNQYGDVSASETSALDVGGFLGAFPLALSRVGVQVTLVEEYDYYYGAFDDLKAFLESQDVEVWAADFTKPLAEASTRRFTFVTNMAMLEHLPSSPKQLMDNLRACVQDQGIVIVEVPNIAYWPTRLRALRGQSVHQSYDLYYGSEPPFMGHHREYTAAELRDLLGWSGFTIEAINGHNYSLTLREGGLRGRLYVFVMYMWLTLLFPGCREVLTATARPRE
jgi:2-polyprenyl-3-methyl-5-hydroxy-6-metoxy-1,4-benzoquinol methylase